MLQLIDDLRIKSLKAISSPAVIMDEFPLSRGAVETVFKARKQAEKIIKGKDDRLLCIVGPCSIHDPNAAMEYAAKLHSLAIHYRQELHIIMRVYFEKPRTTIGWKGLINDPDLNDSFAIHRGLRTARKLLVDLAELGLPAGTEYLDTIIPQFISDTIAWGAIGARTTESQVHRELASGLSMPIGFKNGTDGNINIAIDAIASSSHSHHFLSVSKLGVPVIASTTGNDSTHIILRGGQQGPNYDTENIAQVVQALEKQNIKNRIMIDCSHGNSQKDHTKQPFVARDIAKQIASGNQQLCGIMLESNLVAGKQAVTDSPLIYGKSITDACIDWDTTESVLGELAQAVISRRQEKNDTTNHEEKVCLANR